MTTKNNVISFLATKPKDKYTQFNQAFDLYKKSNNKNLGIEQRFNRVGFSDENLKALTEELKRCYSISDVEIKSYKNPEEIEVVDAINVSEQVAEQPQPIQAPEKVEPEEKQKLRDEFPFLNDANCPDVLHIAVGKKIAAWYRYKELHGKLQQVNEGTLQLSKEELHNLTVETEAAYSDNKALYAELDYYKLNGKVLGNHPMFWQEKTKNEVEKMNLNECLKFRGSSATFFSRKKQELTKAKTDEAKEKVNHEIEKRTYMLGLVNEKIEVANGIIQP